MVNCCDNGLIERISRARAHTPRYRHKRMKSSKYDKGGASPAYLKSCLFTFFEVFKSAKLPERGAATARIFELQRCFY